MPSLESHKTFLMASIIESIQRLCLIDVEKAYDSVWRDGLMYKLH